MVKKIAILGFRGVGKSSVSCQLHKLSGYPLFTLDKIIECTQGFNISEIVKDHGWDYFRDLETAVLAEYSQKTTGILDCGGGILEGHEGAMSPQKYDMLKKNFYCIYLYLNDDKLISRLGKIKGNKSRPALQSDLRETLGKRKPWFEALADYTIDTCKKNPEDIAQMIYERIKLVNA
jgi:shikimate kinase